MTDESLPQMCALYAQKLPISITVVLFQNPDLLSSHTVASEEEPVTTSAIAKGNPEEQKQTIRDRLLPMVQQIQTDLVGKVTDMILELDRTEQLRLLESHEALKSKVGRQPMLRNRLIHSSSAMKVEEAMALLLIHRAEPLPVTTAPST